jgi:acylphosphatase
MKKAQKITLTGDLHRKDFRFYAQQKGIELGITGLIALHQDRERIVIHAEGNTEALRMFNEWCRKGTPYCKATDVVIEETEFQDYPHFDSLPEESYTTNSEKDKELLKSKSGNWFLSLFKPGKRNPAE